MRAVVVYESLWGNTAAVAREIAAGIGQGAEALSTSDATADIIASAELIVAGGPVFAFRLSTDTMREGMRTQPGAPPPNLSAPSMRTWLAELPRGTARCAAFDTRVRGPFGKGSPTIAKELQAKGYKLVAAPQGFHVQGKFGPLRDGELERARRWGDELAGGFAHSG